MPGKIFVSYRRDDDPNGAGRIRDALTAKFGPSSIFMDVDNLLAGLRFDEELVKALAACDVFLAIIGPRWMDLFKTKASSGDRDYMREEIAEALRRKIVVIPVRVGREGQLPPLPRADDLPSEIRDLVHYQKHDVTYEHFRRDASALVDAITAVRRHVRPETPRRVIPRVPWGWFVAAAAIVLTIGWVGAHQMGVSVWWPSAIPQPMEEVTKKQTVTGREMFAALQQRVAKYAPKSGYLKLQIKAVEELLQRSKNRREEETRKRDPVAALAPGSGKSARDLLTDGSPCPFCPEMVVVPAGIFTMGSPTNEWGRYDEEAQVRVTIAAPFAAGKYAVTFDEWDACVADHGCNGHKPGDEGMGRGKHPVINVNWDDARAYTVWLSRKTGKTYRLLSGAEGEYATRAGKTTPFWWGSSITPKQANYDGNYTYAGGSTGEYRQRTVPVDSFDPNPWGLYNVHGNVQEWTEDCVDSGTPVDGRPRATGDCSKRVVRGGSWVTQPARLRSAHLHGVPADARKSYQGFRLARTLNP